MAVHHRFRIVLPSSPVGIKMAALLRLLESPAMTETSSGALARRTEAGDPAALGEVYHIRPAPANP